MNEHAPPSERPATHQDIPDAPRNLVAELTNGGLRLHPRPTSRRVFAAGALHGALYGTLYRGGEWIILFEPEPQLGADLLVPDLAGWRRACMPRLPDVAFFDLVPDWICEILSPGTRSYDLVAKC